MLDSFLLQIGDGGILIITAGLLGLIPAFIADKRGRNFIGWWAFGAALFIVALPLVLILPAHESEQQKKCPMCAEMIKREALKCRFCGYEFLPAAAKDF